MALDHANHRWAHQIILFLCQERYAEEILGDLEEYHHKLKNRNARFSTLRYWYHCLLFLRPYALKTPLKNSNTGIMLKMNLRIALRNLSRDKFYGFINIFGLALGITTCLFIGMFIKDEMSYDRHWENADRIYRITGHLKFQGNEWLLASSPAPMGAAFKEDFPEIKKAARFRQTGSQIFELNERMIKIGKFAYADQEIFQIFSFKQTAGNLNILEPNTAVISTATAQRLYGADDPVGQTFVLNKTTYKVTGVYEDIPVGSHFHFEVLASMENYPDSKTIEWGSNNYYTYFLLEEGTDYRHLQSKITSVYPKYFGPMLQTHANVDWDQFLESGALIEYTLQPITSIHLHSDLSYEIEQNGSFQYIIIFGAAGLFVLIIACINFMNISTARSSMRAKEVGMRKVMGSRRSFLINQFMLESLLNAFIAAIVAISLVLMLLPFFNQIAGKQVTKPFFGDLFLFPWLIGGTIIVGLLAGTYPALYLSAFKPIKVLKGELRLGIKSGWMRNALVVTQFSASVVLIFGAIVISSQLRYIQSKSLGFEREQILILQNTHMMGDKIEAFKDELLNHPSIKGATISSFLPTTDTRSDSPLLPKASTNAENFVSLQIWAVDEHYIPTLNMQLLEGRNFDKNLASDSNAVILNKTAAMKFGFEKPVGQPLKSLSDFDLYGMKEFKVIGIVDDFHFDSFKDNITPMVLLNVRSTGNIALKFEPGSTSTVIDHLEAQWSTFNPTLPFEYTFMDQQFAAKYHSEQKLSTIFAIFSGLAIFIACLGLFGLAAFTTDQRRKELGIRKVLGASLPRLMVHQMSGYTKLLLIAIVLSLPIGFYLMSQWLENFVYRTQINSLMIFLPVGIVMLLAWATVSFTSYRAASQNPVKNLKYE